MNKTTNTKLVFNQKHKRYYIGFVLMLMCFLIAAIFQYNYSKSSKSDLEIAPFQQVVNEKIVFADNELKKIEQELQKEIAGIGYVPQKNSEDISFYIYTNDTLRFWTENEIGISPVYQPFEKKSGFIEIQHSYCIYRTRSFKNFRLVALIRIKNNYSEPNNYLINEFLPDYKMDSRIELRQGSKTDKYALFSPEKEYLFTLHKENISVYNKTLSIWSMLFWIIGLCLLYVLSKNSYILQNKKKPNLKDFSYSFVGLSALIYLGIYFNEPYMMFSQDFFDPIYYASGSLLNSLGNLTIVSIFLLAEISFLYTKVTFPRFALSKNRQQLSVLSINVISAAFFALISWLLNSIIYNSSFEIALYKLENITSPSILAVFLIFSWVIGFVLIRLKSLQLLKKHKQAYANFMSNAGISFVAFIITYYINKEYSFIPVFYLLITGTLDYIYYKQKTHINLSSLSGLLLLFTCFIVYFSVTHSNIKQENKYKALAENLSSGDMMDRNIFSEILFEEMTEKLYKDEALQKIAAKKENAGNELQSYLMKNYFRGFWSNYDIKTYLYDKESTSKNGLERKSFYDELLKNTEQVKNSSFYFSTDQFSKMDYIGLIDLKNELIYIEFYSTLRTTSYSYPEPLINAGKSYTTNNTLSVVRYQNNHISSKIGEYPYPETIKWIQPASTNFYSFTHNDYLHYVYKINASSTLIISQEKANGYYVYIVFGAYLFAIYFIILYIISTLIRLNNKHQNQDTSFLSRLQTAFVFLMIISFLSIFLFSVNYIIKQYENKQNNELQNKTRYIQKYIQESLKQYNNLKETNVVDLNFFLQDLSNTYETDIHIYNEKGFLVASSQPIIFAKGLLSYRISPSPFFNSAKEITQTEHIGKLNYLSAYTVIYNEKNKLLGYIAVPSFLSSTEIQKQAFSLLAVIINVYLFIIFIATLLSFLVNNQLSKPIKALENKIKSFSLKGRNEKLVYTRNDEIGRLVEQYNLMVDKLEKSADKLAQTEREVAWKQMARQITHEINNPLTPMKLSIQQLQRLHKMGSEQYNEYFEKTSVMLIEQIENLSRIATSFSDFAKMPEAKQERINITARLASVVNLFINNKELVKINFEPYPNELFVLADKEQLTQVFNNLIKNAIQAIPGNKKGVITIHTQVKNNTVCIEIKDNGMGVSKEAETLLFSPNFTTKSSGMGLGLAIVKNIVESSGGKIWFKTKTSIGTSFFVEFPLC